MDLIRKTTGLTAGDVALRRVLCPSCGIKIFEKWPLGWDAHAAHQCEGLAKGSHGARKLDFKDRYRNLFR